MADDGQERTPMVNDKLELERATRRTCRLAAAALITGLAETDTSFAFIDSELGDAPGYAKSRIDTLVEGRAIPLKNISDFATATGCRVTLGVAPIPKRPTK